MPTTPLLSPHQAPSPSPSSAVDPDAVTPGVLGFVIFAVIAVVVVLLVIDMVRRIRRVNARARARERIAAELAETPVPDGDYGRDPGATEADAPTRGPTGPAAR